MEDQFDMDSQFESGFPVKISRDGHRTGFVGFRPRYINLRLIEPCNM